MFFKFNGVIYYIKGKEWKALFEEKMQKEARRINKINSKQKVKKLIQPYK